MKLDAKIDYWTFVENYYPNYHSSDEILQSNSLLVKIERLKNSKNNEKKLNKFCKTLLKLDKRIMKKALNNYFKCN